MRLAEQFNLVFFAGFTLLAWLRGLPSGRRQNATVLGMVALAVTGLAVFAHQVFLPPVDSVLRDWLQVPLMLLAYWQAGQFFQAPDVRLQRWLESLDHRCLPHWSHPDKQPRLVAAYLEIAYLFCYPLVPLALGSLYWAGFRAQAEAFWAAVVPASYFCYAMVPFFQTLPPRVREEGVSFSAVPGGLRVLNLHILSRASIQANTFPSAHVAASLAAALAVWTWLPSVGWVWIAISLSIAAAAVLRRYHFALDILIGAAVALACYLLTVR